MKKEVVVVIGAGGIGMAIARRQGFGKEVLLADFNEKLLELAVKELETASYKVSSQHVDVSSRESVRALVEAATGLGSVTGHQHSRIVPEHGFARSRVGRRSLRERRGL